MIREKDNISPREAMQKLKKIVDKLFPKRKEQGTPKYKEALEEVIKRKLV